VDPDNFQPTVSLAEGDDPMPVDTSVTWEIHRAASDGSAGEWVANEYGNTIRTSLEPGAYVITARLGSPVRVSQPLTIVDGEVARPHFVLNAGLVTLRPLPAPDADPADGAGLTFHLPDGSTTTHYGA